MDAAKLDHIHLLGAQLIWLRQHAVLSTPGDIVSLEASDPEPATTARGLLTTSTTDTGFVTQGSSGWVTQGALTSSSWWGLPVMSPRIKPAPGALSEPVLPRGSRPVEYEGIIDTLQRTIAEQTARISALEQKLGDPEELLAR